MADADLTVAINSTSSLIEQLSKALTELEGQKDKVSVTEISEHFHDLEARMMKKYSELEVRENTFKEEESNGRSLLAKEEEDVAAKEQDMYDRIQELKDAAVAAIAEVRANHLAASLDSEGVVDSMEIKVSCSIGETNAPLAKPKEKYPEQISENDNGVAGEVTPRPELTQLCEQMDARGLLNFIMENQKTIAALTEELSLALERANEPGRLVLDSLEGFFPPDGNTTEDGDKKDAVALQGLRQSCLKLLEAMANLLARADSGADHLLDTETKQQAKAIANEWKPKLAHEGIVNATNEKSLEAETFLQLLVTFRIASEFDVEELCKLVLAVAEQRQAPELCRSLGLTHKIPGIIEELISMGKQISAVHFVHAFDLTESFPTVPILKTYLKSMRRNSQGKAGNLANSSGVQIDVNAQELAAVRAVIQCVQKYKLEADFPLGSLQSRASQLEKPKTNWKRFGGPANKHHPKKSRANGIGFYRYHGPATVAAATPVAVGGRQAPPPPVYLQRGAYAGASERYPHAGPSDPYDYQAPSRQTSYPEQEYDQRSYYYLPDDRVTVAAPPTYSGYTGSGVQSSYQPYM